MLIKKTQPPWIENKEVNIQNFSDTRLFVFLGCKIRLLNRRVDGKLLPFDTSLQGSFWAAATFYTSWFTLHVRTKDRGLVRTKQANSSPPKVNDTSSVSELGSNSKTVWTQTDWSRQKRRSKRKWCKHLAFRQETKQYTFGGVWTTIILRKSLSL